MFTVSSIFSLAGLLMLAAQTTNPRKASTVAV